MSTCHDNEDPQICKKGVIKNPPTCQRTKTNRLTAVSDVAKGMLDKSCVCVIKLSILYGKKVVEIREKLQFYVEKIA